MAKDIAGSVSSFAIAITPVLSSAAFPSREVVAAYSTIGAETSVPEAPEATIPNEDIFANPEPISSQSDSSFPYLPLGIPLAAGGLLVGGICYGASRSRGKEEPTLHAAKESLIATRTQVEKLEQSAIRMLDEAEVDSQLKSDLRKGLDLCFKKTYNKIYVSKAALAEVERKGRSIISWQDGEMYLLDIEYAFLEGRTKEDLLKTVEVDIASVRELLKFPSRFANMEISLRQSRDQIANKLGDNSDNYFQFSGRHIDLIAAPHNSVDLENSLKIAVTVWDGIVKNFAANKGVTKEIDALNLHLVTIDKLRALAEHFTNEYDNYMAAMLAGQKWLQQKSAVHQLVSNFETLGLEGYDKKIEQSGEAERNRVLAEIQNVIEQAPALWQQGRVLELALMFSRVLLEDPVLKASMQKSRVSYQDRSGPGFGSGVLVGLLLGS